MGRELAAFESAFGAQLGVDYVAGTGNGMDSIEIALRAIGVGEGDEVITTPMTAFATVLAVIRAGATPVLADISLESGLMDPNSAKLMITGKTKAILLVHLFGHVDRMDEWFEIAREYGLHLVEDCAQAVLASWEGRFAGSLGSAGAFSFYPSKNLGALGDGGAVTSNDALIGGQASVLRNYGQSQRYSHELLGLNSRLDELQAGFLAEKLKEIEKLTAARRHVAEFYFAHISSEYLAPLNPPRNMENHVFHLFVLRSVYRDELIEYLHNEGIDSLIHYPVPTHKQLALRDTPLAGLFLPRSEQFANEAISIPCRPDLSAGDMKFIVKTLNNFRPA